MLHALLHKKNLIGIYSDYQKCKIMFEGLIENHFVDRKNIEIKSYHENTILSGEYNEESIVEEFTDSETTESEKQKKPPSDEEMKAKNELQNSIIELKKKKEKIEESKRVYDVDLELYNKFKKIKENNSNFSIPEMFIEKFDLLEGLEKENKLCWENYYELYKPKNVATGYDKLFN